MTTNRPEFKAHDDFIFEHKEIGRVTREEFIKYIRNSHEHMRKLSQIIQQYNQTFDEYLDEWDGRFESFDDDVKDLLGRWIQDGTIDHIINENLMSSKADKEYVDELHDSTTAQLAHTWKTLEHFPIIPPENDDTNRIKRLIEATEIGETAFIPYYEEWLKVSDTITIDKDINFVSKAKIGYTGTRTKPVFLLENLRNVLFDIFKLVDGNNASDDYETNIKGYHGFENANYVGVEAVNLKWCTLNAYEIRNFYKGVRLRAIPGGRNGGGYWFNYHYIKNMLNNLIGIELNSDGTEGGIGGWFNANYFYDTSFGFNKSGNEPFLEDNRTKYSIKQTVTNGNKYGGESNYFYNLKFEDWESAGKHGGGLVQIYLEKMNDSIFEFRNEISGESNKLAVMNLSVKNDGTGLIPFKSETDNILLIDHTTNPRYNKTIDYINTDEVYNTYPNIARLQGHNELKMIASENSLYSKARKPNDTLLSVKGHIFTRLEDTDYNVIQDRTYGGKAENGEVTIAATSPLTLTLKDIQKGDTFKIIPKGSSPTIRLRVYDKSNTLVDSYYINGVKTLASDFFFNEKWGTLESGYSMGLLNEDSFNFTVNSEDVGSVRVLLTGTTKGYDILSNSQTVTIDKTVDDRMKEQHYMNAIPQNTVNGNYEIGDIVYNTGSSYRDDVGWYLTHTENGLEWIGFS